MSNPWPPLTLIQKTADIIDESERLELSPRYSTGQVYIPVVQMAALLFTGNYVHARHVWKRYDGNCRSEDETRALQEWWKVGRAMMENNPKIIWETLAHIQTTHPAPLNQYAAEVGDAYRRRILLQHPESATKSEPFLTMMNFASPEQAQAFVQQQQPQLMENAKDGVFKGADRGASISDVVSLLEATPLDMSAFQ